MMKDRNTVGEMGYVLSLTVAAVLHSRVITLVDPPPHPVIVAIRDSKDYIRVLIFLLYHYYRVGGPPKSLQASSSTHPRLFRRGCCFVQGEVPY